MTRVACRELHLVNIKFCFTKNGSFETCLHCACPICAFYAMCVPKKHISHRQIGPSVNNNIILTTVWCIFLRAEMVVFYVNVAAICRIIEFS